MGRTSQKDPLATRELERQSLLGGMNVLVIEMDRGFCHQSRRITFPQIFLVCDWNHRFSADSRL
jgi:hypothetical protein